VTVISFFVIVYVGALIFLIGAFYRHALRASRD
jgi:hypothetical protein